jgi:2-polyprenyl-3-methyl-5-hydroxy-6-metoxy-1,4-benzoquinol methylase
VRVMSRFQAEEPEFFAFWRAHQNEDDPQLERWVDYEGEQLRLAQDRVAELGRRFPLKGRRILDVGCQWGATCVALAQTGVIPVGIDVEEFFASGARIRAAEQGVNATFATATAEQLPFPDASFDAVVCVNVLEHVSEHKATIREITRVTKPGGDIYLDGPNRWSLEWFKRDPHYQMRAISLLPEQIGRFYVTRVRRYPSYDVGTFPIASRVERQLRAQGVRIVDSPRARDGLHETVRLNRRPMFFFHGRKASSARGAQSAG